MDTGDFEACVALQAGALDSFRPEVLVGSSFGGAVAVALLQRELWRGPTLLLAQAALRQGLPARLPSGHPIWLVHGTRDELIDIEDSRRLAAAGDPAWVRLIEVDDDHPLHTSVRSERLVDWVRNLAAVRDRSASLPAERRDS
jgi:pimeloyl-ACP methyl ester carboxylesterase